MVIGTLSFRSRCKDKLRKAGIMVTEDSATRQACARKREAKAAQDKKAAERAMREAEDAQLEKTEAEMYREMGLDFLFWRGEDTREK